MASTKTLKYMTMLCSLLLFLNALFTLINRKNQPAGYPGQHTIVPVIYMLISVFVFMSSFNLD